MIALLITRLDSYLKTGKSLIDALKTLSV